MRKNIANRLIRSGDSTETQRVDLSQTKRNDRFAFNFSFLTKDQKYSLAGMRRSGGKAHQKLVEKIEFLSQADKVEIYHLPRESGLEKLPADQVQLRLNPEFTATHRDDGLADVYWIFRLNKLGRVLGKINDNIFYVMAVDTKFDLYAH